MKIIIDVSGEHQSPRIEITTDKLTYPYAIRNSIELALKLDGYSKEFIDEVFGRMLTEAKKE